MGSVGPSGSLPQVFRLSSDTVVKRVLGGDCTFEPYTMGLVATQTSIAVPRVRTHFSDGRDRYIVMEYIEGDDVSTIWPKLSIWRKLWVILTIRGYIRQLRAVPLVRPDVPGPIDGTGTPLPCVGTEFGEDDGGPFDSYDAMAQWFEHKLVVSIDIAKNLYHGNPGTTNLLRFDRSMPLVLTHGDIGMRNVRRGKDGKVWLLDWRFSGAYPEWFESRE